MADQRDPAELAELYRQIRQAETLGDYQRAHKLEAELDTWFDDHEEPTEEEE